MKETTLQSIKNRLGFLQRFIQSPLTVGSVFPSSLWLANCIIDSIPIFFENGPPRHFLEIGPGTGKFTREIVKKLRPQDHLDLIELDEKFCEILGQQFGHLPNVHIHNTSITDWESQHDQYDAIISGLPLNAFPSTQVYAIYHVFQRLIKDHGTLSYFEYLALPKIKKLFLSPEKKEDFSQVLHIKETFYKKHQGNAQTVYLNFPPARVCCLSISKS